MIEILGAPFDLGGRRTGSRLGPMALRMAELETGLRELGLDVTDGGDVPSRESASTPLGMRNFGPLMACLSDLRAATDAALEGNRIPLILGGDHAIAMGGISAALQRFDGDLALLWIDAHADINTPETSASGNVHGMPVAALQGLPSGVEGPRDAEWNAMIEVLGPHRLDPARTAWLGLRDVDQGERPRVRQGLGLTMTEIDRHGIAACVDRLDSYLRGTATTRLWISFDVDALDPVLAPGTGTAVRGGLTYREAHLLAELIHEKLAGSDCPYALAGVDVVETNPLVDTQNATAKMAVEWILSLFGKTVL